MRYDPIGSFLRQDSPFHLRSQCVPGWGQEVITLLPPDPTITHHVPPEPHRHHPWAGPALMTQQGPTPRIAAPRAAAQ